MEKIDTLSPDQEALIDTVYAEYLADVGQIREVDLVVVSEWLKICYDTAGIPVPSRTEIVDSPELACELATSLTGTQQHTIDWRGYGDRCWISRYDFAVRAGILTSVEACDTLALLAFTRCAWGTILLDDCAIVIRRPTVLRVDQIGRMHCEDGPCVAWASGEKEFAWHGIFVSERTILTPRSHTRSEYLAIESTEERRALSEAGGWDWVAQLLGASTIDEWVDQVTGLSYSLDRCESGELLLKKQSPMLQDGTQPFYYEPVDPSLITARSARKWQATWLSVQECERDPDLSYGQES